MKKILAGVVVVALVAPRLLLEQAQAEDAAASKNGKVEQELIKLEDGCNDAYVSADTAFFEKVVADDCSDTDPGGNVTTKAQDIENLKSGALKITSATNDDYNVRVYGKAAVVTYRTTIKGQYKGQDISGRYRGTDTWIKRDGHWQCVATHGTKIIE